MNRIIKILSVLVLTGIIISSCEEHSDDITYEKKSVQFAADEMSVDLLKLPAENETVSFTVEMVSEPLDEDITVKLEPQGGEDVTALEEEHYEILNNTVTIPAGEVEATVDYAEVIHDHFMVEEEVMARVVISEESDLPPSRSLGPVVMDINMKKRNVCPFEATDIVGTYDVTEVGSQGEYPATIEVYYPTDPSEQEEPLKPTFKIGGLWYNAPEVIWGESIVDTSHVEAVFDFTDMANNTIKIPEQYFETSTDGSTEYAYNIYTDDAKEYFSELSHYDGCKKTIKLYYVVDSGGVLDVVMTYINVEEKTAKIKSHTLPLDPRKDIKGKIKQQRE